MTTVVSSNLLNVRFRYGLGQLIGAVLVRVAAKDADATCEARIVQFVGEVEFDVGGFEGLEVVGDGEGRLLTAVDETRSREEFAGDAMLVDIDIFGVLGYEEALKSAPNQGQDCRVAEKIGDTKHGRAVGLDFPGDQDGTRLAVLEQAEDVVAVNGVLKVSAPDILPGLARDEASTEGFEDGGRGGGIVEGEAARSGSNRNGEWKVPRFNAGSDRKGAAVRVEKNMVIELADLVAKCAVNRHDYTAQADGPD